MVQVSDDLAEFEETGSGRRATLKMEDAGNPARPTERAGSASVNPPVENTSQPPGRSPSNAATQRLEQLQRLINDPNFPPPVVDTAPEESPGQ